MLEPVSAPNDPVHHLDPERLRLAADSASTFLRSMANPDRLMLMCSLMQSERCVGDLESATGIRQPTLSQQLAVLREQGLVDTRRAGKFVYYRVTSDQATQLLTVLYSMFCGDRAAGAVSSSPQSSPPSSLPADARDGAFAGEATHTALGAPRADG